MIPKLPTPTEEDPSRSILELIDMDSYRLEKQQTLALALADEDAEIDPVPMMRGGNGGDPERDRLSNILRTFNDLFGNIPWQDRDRIGRIVSSEIPSKLGEDEPFRNAMDNSDPVSAQVEADAAVRRIVFAFMKDDMELFKQFSDNDSFREWVTRTAFDANFGKP